MKEKITIDEIFQMIHWDNDENVQKKGIEAAKEVKSLSVFLQPVEGKALWKNCAIILASKNDFEIEKYIIDLFKWLKDMNWPGADIIYKRLLMFDKETLQLPYSISIKEAKTTNDTVWESVLLDFQRDYQMLSCDSYKYES